MMPFLRRSDRLIAGSVLAALLLAWLLLVVLDAFTALAAGVGNIGKGNYTLATALLHVAWTLPRRAYELFPTAAVVGGLAGLGALAPTAELTALRAGGLSKLRIALGAVGAVAVLLLLVLVLGETLAPWGERQAQTVQAGALSRDVIASGRSGVWARDGETLVNARRGTANGDTVTLFEVRVYDFEPNGRLARVSTAARAEHQAGGWILHEVVRQTFGNDSVGTEKLADVAWPSQLDPRVLSLSIVDPQYLALADLDTGISYLDRNALDAGAWRAAYWRRIFYPLNALLLVLVVMPFAFGALRSGGLGKRLFLGIVLALGWYFLQRAVTNVAAVYNLDFRLTQLLPALALALGAGWYFRRHA
jgi:lipopolysaccharide export system permease protein